MWNLLRRLHACPKGATAIEYSLIAAAIALVIVVAVTQIGTTLQSVFNDVANGI